MNALELWMLKRFCNQFRLDHQEIDEKLTYSEAKQHLISLVPNFYGVDTLAETGRWHPAVTKAAKRERMHQWESEQERYLQEYYRKNILHFYVTYIQEGATKPKETGTASDIFKWRFSLKSWILNRLKT